jgi:hypothetical protein
MKNFKLVALVILFGVLTACNSDKTKKEVAKETPVYSVVGTWDLVFTEIIDGADTTRNFMQDGDVTIRKVLAENNTFKYTATPKENEYDLELVVKGDYKTENGLYFEYLSKESEMDQLMIKLLGESTIYKTMELDESRWILEILNVSNVNKKVTQYWKRL